MCKVNRVEINLALQLARLESRLAVTRNNFAREEALYCAKLSSLAIEFEFCECPLEKYLLRERIQRLRANFYAYEAIINGQISRLVEEIENVRFRMEI